MKIQLTYDEILGYVEDKFHVRPTVEVVDDQALRVSYKISRFVPTISVDIHIDSVSKELIKLSYDCSSVINGLLSGAIGFIEQKVPRHQIQILTDEKRVLVHFDAFKELDKLFAVIEPTDISFNDESVELELLLKS